MPIQFHAADEPLWFIGFAGDMRRLIDLLARYAASSLRSSGIENPLFSIRLVRRDDRLVVEFRALGTPEPHSAWSDFDDTPNSERSALSLPALACKSIAERVGGDLRVERAANNNSALLLDLPLAAAP
jgi:hypothetical protein